MQKVIRYDLIDSKKNGIGIHPQKHVENLGMKVHNFHGVPIGDCIFMLVSNLPKVLPEYIVLSNYTF